MLVVSSLNFWPVVYYSLERRNHSISKASPALNPLTMNDDNSRYQKSATCYQLAQSVLKIGSVLAEWVGQGNCGWVSPSGWQCTVALAAGHRIALVGFFFLAQTAGKSIPLTLRFWHCKQCSVQMTALRLENPDYECSLMSGCGEAHKLAKYIWKEAVAQVSSTIRSAKVETQIEWSKKDL